MRTDEFFLYVSCRKDDLPEMIEEYSGKFSLSKENNVAEILRAYRNLIA